MVPLRCLLAYLVGLPAHEVPAVDIARGDLIEVQPSAYGVKTRMFHFWSGPGRKDGEVVKGGLEGEMEEKESTKGSMDVNLGSEYSSPPRSVLHLEKCYKSTTPGLHDFQDGPKMTASESRDNVEDASRFSASTSGAASSALTEESSTPVEEKQLRDKLESKSPPTKPIELPKAQAPTQQQSRAQTLPLAHHVNSPPILKAPRSHLSQVVIVSTTEDNEAESPTHASKVLPKVETSLGADEAGRVAAKIEAADTRPTFYENVVEGAVKRKKPTGMATTPAKGSVALPGTASPPSFPSSTIPISASPPSSMPLSLSPPSSISAVAIPAATPSSILTGASTSSVPMFSMDAVTTNVTDMGGVDKS